MALDNDKLKSHELAADLMKQIIALSTGLVAVTVTFSKQLLENSQMAKDHFYLVGAGWMCYVVAILAAIGCLMCIAGNLQHGDTRDQTAAPKPPTIYMPNTLFFATGAIVTFAAGTALMAAFAWNTLR